MKLINLKKENIRFKSLDFELKVISITKLTQLYPPYFIFSHLKEYWFYKIWLKFILRVPYWLILSIFGGLFTQFCFVWAFIGRDLLTVIFSCIYIIQLLTFVSLMKLFLHFEGVYKYCLDEFGEDFMEHYIGNPISIIQKHAGKLVFFGGMTALGFGADQYDRVACMEGRIKELSHHVQTLKELKEANIPFEKVDLEKTKDIIAAQHVPRVDQFSGAITNYINDLGSSRRK